MGIKIQERGSYPQLNKKIEKKDWELQNTIIHLASEKSKDVFRFYLPQDKITLSVDFSIYKKIKEFIEQYSSQDYSRIEMLNCFYSGDIIAERNNFVSIEPELNSNQRFFKGLYSERFMEYDSQNRERKPEDRVRTGESLSQKICSLIESNRYEFWSVQGIAGELEVTDYVTIENILRTDKQFRLSWLKTQDWKNLYAPSNKKVKGRERFAQFIANVRSFRRHWIDDYALEYT